MTGTQKKTLTGVTKLTTETSGEEQERRLGSGLKRHIPSEQMAGTTSEGNDGEYLSQIFQFFLKFRPVRNFQV
jgi:hypothetical protein